LSRILLALGEHLLVLSMMLLSFNISYFIDCEADMIFKGKFMPPHAHLAPSEVNIFQGISQGPTLLLLPSLGERGSPSLCFSSVHRSSFLDTYLNL